MQTAISRFLFLKKIEPQSFQRINPESLEAVYISNGHEVKSIYTLRQSDHFSLDESIGLTRGFPQ